MYVWDEAKREANIAKHGLDFVDAYLVFENPEKITLQSPQAEEARLVDIALVELAGLVLVLIYVERDQGVRVISFRRASRRERILYDRAKEPD